MNGNDQNNTPQPVTYDNNNPVHRSLFFQKVQMVAGASLLVIMTSVISGYTTFYLTKESPERKLEKQVAELASTVRQNGNQISTLINQVSLRLPTNLADEKLGRMDDKIGTLSDQINTTRDMVKENRKNIQLYLYNSQSSIEGTQSNFLVTSDTLADVSNYEYICNHDLPDDPEKPHPEGYLLAARIPFEKKVNTFDLFA